MVLGNGGRCKTGSNCRIVVTQKKMNAKNKLDATLIESLGIELSRCGATSQKRWLVLVARASAGSRCEPQSLHVQLRFSSIKERDYGRGMSQKARTKT